MGNYRIVHISDVHIWQFTLNPARWMGKRVLGLGNLALRRARKFRRGDLPLLLDCLDQDTANHLVVTGDLTTTSLPSEFLFMREALHGWLTGPDRATILPGNHDRYTRGTYRSGHFDFHFGDFCEGAEFPFRKKLAPGLELIGFDPNIPRPFSARGLVRPEPLERTRALLDEIEREGNVGALIFGCHYPGEVPPQYAAFEKGHEMVGAHQLVEALGKVKMPVYWLHGHIHRPWEYRSKTAHNVTYLNPGAPLLKRSRGISLGRWILDWDGQHMRTEWRSTAETAGYFRHHGQGPGDHRPKLR
jgi:3',5'-cyclic AMP phosphodiesterase CpdA